ncbi:MAG: hypothetical protein WCQ53_01635 [bacterium]
MPELNLSYAGRLLSERERFDAFLNGSKDEEKDYLYLSMVRNLYLSFEEIGIADDVNIIKFFFSFLKDSILFFFTSPKLSTLEDIVILNVYFKYDNELSKRLQFPLTEIKLEKNVWTKNFTLIKEYSTFLKLTLKLLLNGTLKRAYVIKCIIPLLRSILIYNKLSLKGVRKIITQRDRYPEETALILKAKKEGVKTLRIEPYPSMGAYNRDSIICDYYFYPNEITAGFFKAYPGNSSVKFIKGGFPYWDFLSEIKHAPILLNDRKIISYWTQYGQEMGIFGNKGPQFYIDEILSVGGDDYYLYIKVHPLDDPDNYSKYKDMKNVRVLRHGEVENGHIMSISEFSFSINSFSSFESKHVNQNVFFINYDPQLARDFDYSLVDKYIDVITDRKMLAAFLTGSRTPKDSSKFIEYFNPSFPHSIDQLKKVVNEI